MKSPQQALDQLHQNIRELERSATLSINERSKALIRAGRRIYRLGFGQSPFPVPDIVIKALQHHAGEKDYLDVQGLIPLREAIAGFYNRKYALGKGVEDVMIGPGSKELIYILQVVHQGRLILPSPSWVSYAPQAKLSNKAITWVDTNEESEWKMRAEDLDKVLTNTKERKIVLINYPNNPAGTTYSTGELKALAQVVRRHDCLVVSDEIYGELHFDGQHDTLARYYPEGTIISSGISKWCGAGGWRLGHFTFPDGMNHLVHAMTSVASETFTATSAPIQYAAVTAYWKDERIDVYVTKARKILHTAARYVHDRLSKMDVNCPMANGGFYLFPNFGKHRTRLTEVKDVVGSQSLCEILLAETGIALLPGVAFGRPANELTTRLSFVDFDGKKALEVDDSETINIKAFAPDLVEAMDRLERWLG